MELASPGFVLVAIAQLLVLAAFFKVFMIRRARSKADGAGDSSEVPGANGSNDSNDGVDRSEPTGSGGVNESTESIGDDAEVITCIECGERNEAGYRFCRQCVEELPGPGGRFGSGNSPGRRGIF